MSFVQKHGKVGKRGGGGGGGGGLIPCRGTEERKGAGINNGVHGVLYEESGRRVSEAERRVREGV